MDSLKVGIVLITLLLGLYQAPCFGRVEATYYINTDVSGPQDGLTEETGWEDWARFVSWAMDGNDPISRDEFWTVYLSGSTPDTNAPVDCNIPTDKNHNIKWVGDLAGDRTEGEGSYYNLAIIDTSQIINWTFAI